MVPNGKPRDSIRSGRLHAIRSPAAAIGEPYLPLPGGCSGTPQAGAGLIRNGAPNA
ncbi:hypothetical protein RR42_m1816 [Cupriavidus basilensis]|uniref:Uncharacterized protein n=1 Tax=Cupriavidus basilensis TaxID=68895 RepID=A0A0C4YEI9_9BURK|nr:hypothetical protein RR42_m1816 [Cupriavidus basilensis]